MKKNLISLIIIVSSCILYRGYSDSFYEVKKEKDVEVLLENGRLLIIPKVGTGMRHVTNHGLNISIALEVINNSSEDLILDLESLRKGVEFRDELRTPDLVKTNYAYYNSSDTSFIKNRYINLYPNQKEELVTIYNTSLFEGVRDNSKEKTYNEYVRQYKLIVACEEVKVILEDFIILENDILSVDTLRFRGNSECNQ